MEESGWLIEHGESDTAEPMYWTGLKIMQWSKDHMQALRFARECDASTIASGLLAGVPTRVCEHGWG